MKCLKCKQIYGSPQRFRCHTPCAKKRRVGDTIKYICSESGCPETRPSQMSMAEHITIAHFLEEDSIIKCKSCHDARFLSLKAFGKHYLQAHNRSSGKPGMAKEVESLPSTVKVKKRYTPKYASGDTDEKKPKKPFSYKDLDPPSDSEEDEMYSQIRDLSKKLETLKDVYQDPKKCSMAWCGKTFPTQEEVVAHFKEHLAQPNFGKPKDWVTII